MVIIACELINPVQPATFTPLYSGRTRPSASNMDTLLLDPSYLAVYSFMILPGLFWLCLAIYNRRQVTSVPPSSPVTEKPVRPRASQSQLDRDKQLYHQLHNLESHLECLPTAHSRLVSLFSETLSDAMASKDETILTSLPHYDREQLESFMKKQHDATSQRYEEYLARRRNVGGQEMFPDRETAIYWLRNSLCVKYVDGSWTGEFLDFIVARREPYI